MKSGKKSDLKENKKELYVEPDESDNDTVQINKPETKRGLTEEEKGEVLSRERHESDLKENQKLAKEKEAAPLIEGRELTERKQQGEVLCRERHRSDLKENKKVLSVEYDTVQNVKPETKRGLTEEENVQAQNWIKVLANPSIRVEEQTLVAERVLASSEALQEKVKEGLKEVLWEKEELVWKKVQREKKDARKEKQRINLEKKSSTNQNKKRSKK